MSGVEVIIQDTSKHPRCPHGPTTLFSRTVDGKPKRFFACSACRDRKDCNFFLWEGKQSQVGKSKIEEWKLLEKAETRGVNHRNLFLTFNETMNLPASERMFRHDCSSFQLPKYKEKHREHDYVENISDHLMRHPSEILKPLDNAKREAQYLFSEKAVKTIVGVLRDQKLLNVLCIGTPRIHEYISSNCDDMSSLLLDIDKRYHNFFGPLQFCWYNAFNHHFFLNDAREMFTDFLTNSNSNLAIMTDPPFGGRVEPLAAVINTITTEYASLSKNTVELPVLWAFPYFMEPQILNSLPNFHMLDYKVEYDNHPLFSDGPKGRKHGSPVRLFTNIEPSSIKLPIDEGYKHCKKCCKWVSSENKHCDICKSCTSKDGRTYIHCNLCRRCVKPTWKHCDTCEKCAQPDHKCNTLEFVQECFHCKGRGHKKRDCPKVDREALKRSRQDSILKTKRRKQ